MSYARFGWDGSDVYVFEHTGGGIECCGCCLTDPAEDTWFGSMNFKTPREALAHLEEHVAAGHCVPSDTFNRMREEYKDSMDTVIEAYETPPEVRERQRKLLRGMLGLDDES